MEAENMIRFFEGKNILITGATGFLAKILVEKILRIQPNVKKLLLLIRNTDTKSVTQRFYDEVVCTELFRLLREKWGEEEFIRFVSEKVHPVCGDISLPNLGIEDCNFINEICWDIDFIVNAAGVTKFDERYDVAIDINTSGANHILDFAKKCVNLKVLLHVSTAYVCGEQKGCIEEKELIMGETPNGIGGLDIDAEKKLVNENLSKLRDDGATREKVRRIMKDLGLQRARLFGWPNTYSFTKAMGEMILVNMKGSLPVVIVRPTIITSTYKEPFPGWIEGCRTIDSLIVAYGKGKLKRFIGSRETILDFIPGDMVVNSIIVAMMQKVTKNQTSEIIYHIGSSSRNPIKLGRVSDFSFQYFTKKPYTTENGDSVIVTELKFSRNMAHFRFNMGVHYFIAKGLSSMSLLLCRLSDNKSDSLTRKIKYIKRVGEIYRPYVYFKGVFDDQNTGRLRIEAREWNLDEDLLYFDPSCITWEDYFMSTHFPGVEQYLMK